MASGEMDSMRRGRDRRRRRSGLPVLAALAALGMVACEPAPPPDGRDLGVALDAAPPTHVEKGGVVALSGTVTNHGTAPASGVTVDYGITGGFTLDAFDVAGADCSPVTSAHVVCTLPEPLGAGESVAFTASSTAGEVSGPQTHLIGANSDGTEPEGDENEGFVVVPVDVRPAPAEPQPLAIGNGTNYLGTGRLLGSTGWGPSEELFLSVNPFCTDKVNGDRFQSGYSSGPGGSGTARCTGSPNAEYRPSGYAYDIEIPANPRSAVDVMLWDPRYNWNQVQAGEIFEAPIDRSLSGQGAEVFTFTLLAPDATPHDDLDNPSVCSRTFSSGTAFDGGRFLGSVRWNKLCTITNPQPGRYILRVQNSGSVTSPVADGSNNFGVVAAYVADGADPATVLCRRDERADCPVVSGAGMASISVDVAAYRARVALGEIGPEQEGRRLNLELFDPGEGGRYIRILRPTAANTWAPVEFDWSSESVGSGTTSLLPVRTGSADRFNGRVLEITVDLAGYQAPPDNRAWLVEYEFAGQSVTDRTTWTAWVADHP